MIDEVVLVWVEHQVGERPAEARSLRDGGSPWLLRFAGRADLVLRTGDRELVQTESTGLAYALAHGVPAPALIAADLDGAVPMLLVTAVDADSTIPFETPAARLHRLGSIAATLHAIDVPDTTQLPYRDRPIGGVDFAALRAHQPVHPLLARAESVVARGTPAVREGFVHGDLWQGNCMWRGDDLVALIDWDCAGRGPAGVDLGSLRFDAALCFGLDTADLVLAGWADVAGRPPDDVAHWDAVAALSSPNDMGWFVGAIAGQGRPDLTQQLLVERRDAFLEQALDRLS